jgi:AcrR family transcriptional regulator
VSSARSQATRAAILDATLRLLERDGYHAVGLAAVADEAGVSRQAIYLHFASKMKLLKALVDALQEKYVVPAFERRRVWESGSGLEALDAWVDVVTLTMPPILAVANAVDAARRSDPEAETIWRRPMRSRYEGCLRIARWLEQDGTLAPGWDPSHAARFLWALTSFRLYEDLTSHGWSRRRYAEYLQRSLRAALTITPGDDHRIR